LRNLAARPHVSLESIFKEYLMETRHYVRSAALSGAALLLLATGAQAASSSTAREREVTRQLNMQASQAAQPQEAVKDAAANVAANTPPAAAPTMAVQTATIATASSPVANAPLTSLTNPPSIIATANVLDRNGQTVGAVQKVEVSPSGTPTHVVVALIGPQEHLVVLDAATLSYDAGNNRIIAQVSADAIKAMGNAG
jgi:hypothetical protein